MGHNTILNRAAQFKSSVLIQCPKMLPLFHTIFLALFSIQILSHNTYLLSFKQHAQHADEMYKKRLEEQMEPDNVLPCINHFNMNKSI